MTDRTPTTAERKAYAKGYADGAKDEAARAEPRAAPLDVERLRAALFDEYGVNVVDEALDVAINAQHEMRVNRERWEAARAALRAALEEPTDD